MLLTSITPASIVCAIFLLSTAGVSPGDAQSSILPEVPEGVAAISFLGKRIPRPTPSATALRNLEIARANHAESPTADNVIWYGRRLGYAGQDREAIRVFTEGIRRFPEDARLYRHRGHRYISIRELDRAIADLTTAADLVEGQPNEVEPDGAPNKYGIPVSTLHHNIWYHLGLAYYLKHDWPNARLAYDNAFKVARNGDNLASITHWRYSILRRMGRTHDEAKSVLEAVSAETKVLENHNYLKLDLFYKGEVPLEEMLAIAMGNADVAADASLIQGVANWYLYNDDPAKGYALMEHLVAQETLWGAFGYLASEADLAARK
jgi:tetratricopeptide (TPR) repeat protein